MPVAVPPQTLLNMLPTLDVWWRRFHQYFSVLLAFANAGEGPRQYLLARGLAAQLIDFVLQDDSPHPELNNVPANQGTVPPPPAPPSPSSPPPC